MNRILNKGYQFAVAERNGVFEIKSVLGQGASCVVYNATFTDEYGNTTEHLLKEYNPKHTEMHRKETGELCLENETDRDDFEIGLKRFRAGYDKQLRLRLSNEDLKNPTCNIQGIYHINGTEYIDMTCFHGANYDDVKEISVYNLVRRMKALATVIGNYHKAGLLHLDIKPANIFTLPETEEMVMLFDFDSVTDKNNIMSNEGLSFTKSWAAPEQILTNKRKSICEATDIFAVGEIIFYQLMGRHSTPEERRSFITKYEYDYTAPIFSNINPKVFPMLDELLHHTICGVVKERYQSTAELVEKLNSIIDILSSTEPYLISNIKSEYVDPAHHVKSLIKIHENLQSTGRHFNKSTSKRNVSKYAMEYIKNFGNYYESVSILDCNNGFIDAFLDIFIVNFDTDTSKSTYEQVLQIFNILEYTCDNKALIILDNFDERYLVDPKFASNTYHCDIQQVYDICLRLLFINASILVNGTFDTANFYKKEHYRHFHELLYNLAEKCYHKQLYGLAKDYIKKAISIVQGCSSAYVPEYNQKDKSLLQAIQIDFVCSAGYGFDADEVELDSYLEQFEDCVDDI